MQLNEDQKSLKTSSDSILTLTFKYNDNGETRWLEFAPFLHQSKDFRFLYDKLNDADMKDTLYSYFVPSMEELLNDRIIKQKISDLYEMSPRVSFISEHVNISDYLESNDM